MYKNCKPCNTVGCEIILTIYKMKHTSAEYCIAEKFGGEKVWRIDCFRAFGERKFGELIDQPIGYQL